MPPISRHPEGPDDLMTAIDAARILGLSVDMVRRLAKDGRLPFMSTIRGVRLFRRSSVEQLALLRARGGARKNGTEHANGKAVRSSNVNGGRRKR
jgi:excisionase family DNA binding protein